MQNTVDTFIIINIINIIIIIVIIIIIIIINFVSVSSRIRRERSCGSVLSEVGGKRTGVYIKKVQALWGKKGLNVQEEPCFISQSKCNKLNSLLTKMESSEFEEMITDEIGEDGDQRS